MWQSPTRVNLTPPYYHGGCCGGGGLSCVCASACVYENLCVLRMGSCVFVVFVCMFEHICIFSCVLVSLWLHVSACVSLVVCGIRFPLMSGFNKKL